MENLEELLENMDFNENSYFYYITEKGNSNDIFEQGIFMDEDDTFKRNIIIAQNIKDPVKFCKKVLKKRTLKEKEMIIVEIEKGEENKLIIENYDPLWNAEKHLKYLIIPEYIMCSIDLDTLKVIYNLEYHYSEYPRGA